MLSNLFKRFEQYDQSFDKSKRKSDQKLFKSRRIIPKTEFLQVWNYKVQVASKLKNEWAIRVQKVFELYKINPKLFLRSITFPEKNIFKTRCQVGILLLFFFWGWGGGSLISSFSSFSVISLKKFVQLMFLPHILCLMGSRRLLWSTVHTIIST